VCYSVTNQVVNVSVVQMLLVVKRPIESKDGYLKFVCLFVFLALQPTVVVFSQPGSGL
jgi:hypothetical protein